MTQLLGPGPRNRRCVRTPRGSCQRPTSHSGSLIPTGQASSATQAAAPRSAGENGGSPRKVSLRPPHHAASGTRRPGPRAERPRGGRRGCSGLRAPTAPGPARHPGLPATPPTGGSRARRRRSRPTPRHPAPLSRAHREPSPPSRRPGRPQTPDPHSLSRRGAVTPRGFRPRPFRLGPSTSGRGPGSRRGGGGRRDACARPALGGSCFQCHVRAWTRGLRQALPHATEARSPARSLLAGGAEVGAATSGRGARASRCFSPSPPGAEEGPGATELLEKSLLQGPRAPPWSVCCVITRPDHP